MPKYDLLATADLHLGNDKGCGGIGKDGVNSFLKVCEKLFMNMIDKAKKYDIPMVIAGDLCDSINPDPKTKRVLHRCLKHAMDLNVTMVIITGNHEYIPNGSLIDAYADLSLRNISFIAINKTISINEIDFYCVPYMGLSNEEQYAAVSKMCSSAKKNVSGHKKVLLLHYPIVGAKYNSNKINKDNGFNLKGLLKNTDNPFDRIFAGDFHKRQRIKGVDNFLYVGSPFQDDFNAVGDKRGYTLVDFKNNMDTLIIDPICPTFHVLEGVEKPSDIVGDFTNKIVKMIVDTDCDHTRFSDRLLELGALKTYVRKKSVNIEEIDIEDIDYSNLFSNQVDSLTKFVLNNSPDKLDKEKLLKAGLDLVRESRARAEI